MNKYDRLMREIVEYLAGTWLSQPWNSSADRGPIQGCSEAEIEAAEQRIGLKLPAALKAWYRVAGKVPPYLNDYDADYSLRDLLDTHDIVYEITHKPEERFPDLEVPFQLSEASPWLFSETSLPFSSRLGEQLVLVETGIGDPNDPPVFHFAGYAASYRKIEVAYSVFVREMLLGALEFSVEDKRNDRSKPESRRNIIYDLRQDEKELRRRLIETVYQEDIAEDEITGPREFQARWIAEFNASDLPRKFKAEGLRFPYNWVDAPGRR